MQFSDPYLVELDSRLQSGHRITPEDAESLFNTRDLAGLGWLADRANQQLNGRRVFFNINRHINPTNVCINRCQFCAFYRKSEDEAGAYVLPMTEILERLKQDVASGCTEVHVVGGLHPEWSYERYRELVAGIHEAYPAVHIKAFTCVEIDHFSTISGLSISDVLADLKSVGLGSMPGGGAEIFTPDVRRKLCAKKISADRWLEIAAAAHGLDIPTNATMLYGHIETVTDRVDHLRRLRDLQDRTGGFQAFIPLSWHKENTELERKLGITGATGLDDLKVLAVSRLFLDNFNHVKAYWVMLGKKLAQTALHFGANDLDGTVVDETITYMAGQNSDRFASREEIIHLIRSADRIPVERDTLYRPLKEYTT